MRHSISPKAFMTILMAIPALILILIALLNVVVDPYNIFQMPTYSGFNKIKITNQWHTLPLEVVKAAPSNVIIGSSRVYAYPLAHPLFKGDKAIRIKVAGMTIREQSLFFKNALVGGNLKSVVFGLDYFSFHIREINRDVYPQELFFTQQPSSIEIALAHINEAGLFSINTVIDSIQTIIDNKFGEMNVKFQRQEVTPVVQPRTWEKFSVFNAQFYNRYYIDMRMERRNGKHTTAYITDILDACRDSGAKLYFVINPIHASLLETIKASGSWEIYKTWIEFLQQVVSKDMDHPCKPELWYFSGYNIITTEKIPFHGDNESMQYYQESVHFKPKAAYYIFDALNGEKFKNFGVKLNGEDLNIFFQTLQELSKIYVSRNKIILNKIVFDHIQ